MKASTSIPLLPRLFLTIIEPLMSLHGVFIVLQHPQQYLDDYLTRGAITYTPNTQTLYTQLAGFWIFFTFIQVFVLRSFDDLRLWKRILMGMLVSDAVYWWAAAQAVGGWGEYWNLGVWSGNEWVLTVGTLVPVGVRLFVVLGV